MTKNKQPSTFRWLNATQFFGALNDNMFKFLIIFFLIGIQGAEQAKTIQGIAGIIFVVPFLLFSHAAGVLADRYSKRTIIVGTKVFEIGVMCLGALSFYLGLPLALYGVLFLMAVQSAFFGPSKYGIIPELVSPERISKANSYLVSFTFLAIIIGTSSAPLITHFISGRFEIAAVLCAAFALVGTGCSLLITETPAKKSNQEFTLLFLRDIRNTIFDVYKDKYLFGAILGGSYFWLLGAYVQLNIIPYGIEVLGLSAENSTYLFLVTAVGIAIGSSLAGKLSGRNIEFGIVPLGACGMAITCIALNFISEKGFILTGLIIVLMGISAGLFIVPLSSFIQYRSPENRRGEILATANFINFIGILFAAALILAFTHFLSLSAAQGFLALGLATFVLMVASLIVLPDFLLRFIALAVMKIFYRLRICGIENIPLEGGALLVSNHISWVDALLLTATNQRRIRFLMERKYYSIKWLNPLMRLLKVIPISVTDSPKTVLRSLRQARSALDDGYLVCIFAEGQISRTGNMGEFRKGFERITKGSNHPIIPVYIGGAWGSIFSYYSGQILSRFPAVIPYPVTVIFGTSMSPTSTALDVRLAVMELASKMFLLEKPHRKSLATLFIQTARQSWFRKAISEPSGKRLTYGQTLVKSISLAGEIDEMITAQEKIGILLPASIEAVLANIAISLLGKTPINLNFTESNQAIQAAITQCQIKTIISSRAFINTLKNDIKINRKLIFVEDILTQISSVESVLSYLKAFFLPLRALDKNPNNCADNLATIIFSTSSSSVGPEGVMLSHHNIISNIESLRMVFRIGPKDRMCAPLPFFHAFGYTGSFWLPLISGLSVCYHADSINGVKIAETVRTNSSTILMATPELLKEYLRQATKDDFKTLRYVVVGRDKLARCLADAFQKKFNLQTLEGYGATELSPVASVNIPNVEINNVKQIGLKDGSVGQPLPGVIAKIVNPKTYETLPVNSFGLLFVKGPNVMCGYLNEPGRTAEVLRDGWYNTRDMAAIGHDGFITIIDRLSRFSKIDGEVVSHSVVEEEYLNNLGVTTPVLVVISFPDKNKGEKLVVCHVKEAGTAEELHSLINKGDLPNPWKPSPENYVKISAIPFLDNGKPDHEALKKMINNEVE